MFWSKKIRISGVTIEKVYPPEGAAQVAFGRYRIKNRGKQPISLSVEEVICRMGDQRKDISSFFVYTLPEYEELDPLKIRISEKTEIDLEISFPALAANTTQRGMLAVEAVFREGSRVYPATSEYHFIFRHPSDQE